MAGNARAAIALAVILVIASVLGFSRFQEAFGARLLAHGQSEGSADVQDIEDGSGTGPGGPEESDDPATLLIVHVDGAVGEPGVYRIRKTDARVIDAVEAAGGLLEDARTDTVNLAAVLQDGQKIHIPSEEELEQAQASPCISSPASSGSAMALIDLNTARVEELTTLPGVGEVTARTIVENREREGPFTSPEDLMRVPGIGEKKYERLKDRIRV
ncbi:MAG: helix-hairpin-helix domain-containing protein [Atopobiaceae bacterium]|nr:helix-hairpin-helix domain-containing protein [Atopobiaceae bacterium]